MRVRAALRTIVCVWFQLTDLTSLAPLKVNVVQNDVGLYFVTPTNPMLRKNFVASVVSSAHKAEL